MPKRIQRKRSKGWRMPGGAVYVGRPGPWGNPFIVGKHGPAAECVDLFRRLLGGFFTLGLGREHLDGQMAYYDHARAHLHELRGKDLACWCRLDRPCHVDVLLEAANADHPGE